jgi:hypothetical protein
MQLRVDSKALTKLNSPWPCKDERALCGGSDLAWFVPEMSTNFKSKRSSLDFGYREE